jgi:hypothetical protein
MQPPAFESLGGGALYCIVGARLWLPPHKLRTLVDKSREGDLGEGILGMLDGFGREMWVYNEGEGTRMPRAKIAYEGDLRT